MTSAARMRTTFASCWRDWHEPTTVHDSATSGDSGCSCSSCNTASSGSDGTGGGGNGNDTTEDTGMTEPIDPYWWCRHDEELARKVWENVEKPFLLEQFARFADPKFWEVPEVK